MFGKDGIEFSKWTSNYKIINLANFKLIVDHFDKAKLSYDIKKYFSKKDTKKIISYMQKDKKNNSQKINLVLLKKIGVVDFRKDYSKKQIQFFISKFLMN